MDKFNRMTDLIAVDEIHKNGNDYTIVANHNRSGVSYEPFREGTLVNWSEIYDNDIGSIPTNLEFKDEEGNPTTGPILAVWKVRNLVSKEFYDLKLGASDYEGVVDSFQVCDEIYSRFINQIRATQPILFMSEELMGFTRGTDGNLCTSIPTDLGIKVFELAGGLENVDGVNIKAMFNRDVPTLEGVEDLRKAFEWTLRHLLIMKGLAPTSGNAEDEKVGSNTTSSSLFKREQSTHLIRKQMIEAWSTAIKKIVRLMCQWFDIIDGKTVPDSYEDLKIDVNFPDLDIDDFNSRLDQAVKGFTAGLFDIKEGIKHAFKNKLTQDEIEQLIKNLEEQKEKEQERQVAKANNSEAQKADALAKQAKLENKK